MFDLVDGFAINMPVVILGCRKDKTGKTRPVGSDSLIALWNTLRRMFVDILLIDYVDVHQWLKACCLGYLWLYWCK